jgi:hypothetical protein
MQARSLSGNGSASGVNKSVITGKRIQAELDAASKPRAAEEKEAKAALAQVEALVQAEFSAEDSEMGGQADAPAPALAEVKGEGEAKERKLARQAMNVVSDDKLPVVSDEPATCAFLSHPLPSVCMHVLSTPCLLLFCCFCYYFV